MTWTTKFLSDAKCHGCCRTVRGGAEPDEEALKQTFESSPQPAGGNSEDGKQPLGENSRVAAWSVVMAHGVIGG